MPAAEIVALRDRPALTANALAGTEKLIADDGTADGLVTAQQVADLALSAAATAAAALYSKKNFCGGAWTTGTDPNGIVSGQAGDFAFDFAAGVTWTKTTDGGTTGWV